MSGPKVDVAELRRQEKERLAQARRRRLDSADKIQKIRIFWKIMTENHM